MDIKIMFFEFLKREGVAGKFMTNFINSRACDSLKDLYESSKPIDLLFNAFMWDRTPQGYSFWYGVYMEWVRLLHRENERSPIEGFRPVEGICIISPASLDYLDEEPIN